MELKDIHLENGDQLAFQLKVIVRRSGSAEAHIIERKPGIISVPPRGCCEVTNLFVRDGKLVVEWNTTPAT
jgi:hypothetical protein